MPSPRIIPVILSICLSATAEETLTPESVFAAMKVADGRYMQGLTVSGTTRDVSSIYEDSKRSSFPITFRMTQTEDTYACETHALEFPADWPLATEDSGASFTAASWVFASRETYGQTRLFTSRPIPDLSIPALKRDAAHVGALIMLFPPAPRKRMAVDVSLERAMGRGYTRHAIACIYVGPGEQGLLEIHLTSNDQRGGVWTLQVDPALDYLVRKGQLERGNSSVFGLTVENSGLIQGPEGLYLPAKASVIDSDRHEPIPYTFESAAFEADAGLTERTMYHLTAEAFPEITHSIVDSSVPGRHPITTTQNREP